MRNKKTYIEKGIIHLFFLFFVFDLYSQDTLIVQAKSLSDYLPVYKDSIGILKIGEIPKGKHLYLIAPGGQFSFFVYGDGVKGYSPISFIEFNKYVARGLNHNNIDWKINEAKQLDIEFGLDEIRAKQVADSIALKDSLENVAGLRVLLAKGIKDGLHVTDFTITGNDYKIGFRISISNYVKKTIKYIHITVAGINDVNDIEGIKTFKGVGPIQFLNQVSYLFEDAFFSRVITKLKISKISVEYMDGNKKDYVGAELKKTLVYDRD